MSNLSPSVSPPTLRRTIGPMSERIAAALAIPHPARPSAGVGALAVASVLVATLVIALVEQVTAIADASAVYLVAVVVVAMVGGTAPAIATRVRRIHHLRPPVHGATAVACDLGPRRAPQPRPRPDRGPGRRSARGPRSPASRRGRTTRDRGDRALLDQPSAGHRRPDDHGRGSDRRPAGARGGPRSSLDRPRRRRSRTGPC